MSCACPHLRHRCVARGALGLGHTLLTGQVPQVLGDAVFALSAVQNKALTVRALALLMRVSEVTLDASE